MFNQIFNRSGSHFTKIRAVIVVGFAILLLLFFSTNDFFSKKEAELSYRNVLNMAVDGDEFWVARAKEHGFQTAISANDSELIHHLRSESFADMEERRPCSFALSTQNSSPSTAILRTFR